MVRKFSVEELAKRIKQRNVITKASVLDESKWLPNPFDMHILTLSSEEESE